MMGLPGLIGFESDDSSLAELVLLTSMLLKLGLTSSGVIAESSIMFSGHPRLSFKTCQSASFVQRRTL
jgi:hypothetical protein